MKWLIIILLITTNAYAEFPDTEPNCLAANIYFEARGEALMGQYMVAYVTMNRVKSVNYPDSICEVVKQPKQFSWFNPKKERLPTKRKAWDTACSIAAKFLLDHPISKTDLSQGALYYHANYITPVWSKKKTYIGRVGSHLFYK